MEDQQKLNLLRLAVDNASDFGEAKEYASFIFGFKEHLATRIPSDDEEEGCKNEYIEPIIEDGVYIVEKGFLPRRFEDGVGVQNLKECDVMVSYHGHKWVVAKENLKGDELPLFSDDSHPEDTSSLYKREIEALNDFDMKSCTEHLRKAGIAFELDTDLYIPTAGQFAAMYLYQKELDKALEMVGGTPMKEEVYWSSSEIGAYYSWNVDFNDGYVNNFHKYGSLYVRPCMPFELKKKGFSKWDDKQKVYIRVQKERNKEIDLIFEQLGYKDVNSRHIIEEYSRLYSYDREDVELIIYPHPNGELVCTALTSFLGDLIVDNYHEIKLPELPKGGVK